MQVCPLPIATSVGCISSDPLPPLPADLIHRWPGLSELPDNLKASSTKNTFIQPLFCAKIREFFPRRLGHRARQRAEQLNGIADDRMSKSSTTSTNKSLPAKSAWSKGPPTSAPSPRSQSPAPSAQQQPQPTHSRRPSALGSAVPIKDGVTIPRNIGAAAAGKQGQSAIYCFLL